MSNRVTLEGDHLATRLPVKDLERARLFYAEKLVLEPVEEGPGDFCIAARARSFALFISSGASSSEGYENNTRS